MQKALYILIISFFLTTPVFANDRGACIPYFAEYGENVLYDLNQVPVLEMVKNDLEKSNLLGNIPSAPQGDAVQKLFYQNGSLFMETPFLNGKKNGIQKIYYNNQNLLTQINYVDDQINGDVTVYYSNGNVKMTVTYQNGQKTGSGKMFYWNGNLQLVENYQNGLLEGVQTQYYEDGMTVQSIIPYTQGIINGTVKLYYSDATVLAIVAFEQGIVTSNTCYTKVSQQSSLNKIGLYKLQNGMRPIYCSYWTEDNLY